jgi:hypothetical protein
MERSGGASSDGSPNESFDEQLAAEIADHLAAAADDLVRRGQAEDEATRAALARFGDVARIKRQCWWIHNGEDVMFRTAGIALLSLLTIGVAVVGFGGWQLQRNLASRTEELSGQLASLAATQEAMLAQQRPPEITGRAYLGDPSKPAKDVEIQVFRFSEEPQANSGMRVSGVVTRRLRTDAQGHFDSGILQSGEYCLLAPLLNPEGRVNENELLFTRLQSHPLYLTSGVGKSAIDLNLAAPARIRLSVDNIPNSLMIGEDEVRVFVQLAATTDGVHFFERKPVPPNDQPPCDGWPLPLPALHIDIAGGGARPDDLPRSWWLPPRNYSIALSLSFQRSKENTFTTYRTTKTASLDVKLAGTNTATLTLSLLGDSLQQQAEVAAKEFETNPQAVKVKLAKHSITPMDGAISLQNLAVGVELKAALAIDEKGGTEKEAK